MKHQDKILHFLGGIFITSVFGWAFHPIAGLTICAFVAWYKEQYDKKKTGNVFDGGDAYATLLGAVPGQLIVFMLEIYG